MEKQLVERQDVTRLQAQHQEAEMRLRELDRHLSLSPDERLEVARLKKHKLHLKDEIRARTPAG